MKQLYPLLLLFLSSSLCAQSYQLQVQNGYGSGSYEAGDTVYIFSRELGELETFRDWTFDQSSIEFLADEGEWRLAFKMPATDLMCRVQIDTLPADFLQLENIPAINTEKPVYSAFPPNPKGSVFLFHGTSGSTAGWIGLRKEQNYSFLKDLYQAGYGVIVTESEESTLNRDLNGDGKIRWLSYPIDTLNNIDYQNMKVVIDTFQTRGLLDRNSLFSAGMSSGGSFSGTFSVAFGTKASAIYGASSQLVIAQNGTTPLLFCMMPRDEIIGEQGNEDARTYHQMLLDRGICSQYFENIPFPLYPEYFQRTGLDAPSSNSLHAELGANNWLNAKGFVKGPAEDILADVLAQTSNWPNFRSLTPGQRTAAANLIDLAHGGHKFFSNHNKRTIQFFDNACDGPSTSTSEAGAISPKIIAIPNPSRASIQLQGLEAPFDYELFDGQGRLLKKGRLLQNTSIDDLPSGGLFFLQLQKEGQSHYIKLLRW
ncbi:MAG: T9SS type A sorting domain-containing protein [Bacteroidota bacterium]